MSYRLLILTVFALVLTAPVQGRADIPGLDGDTQQQIIDDEKDIIFSGDGPLSYKTLTKDKDNTSMMGKGVDSMKSTKNSTSKSGGSSSDGTKYRFDKREPTPKELVPRSFPHF